jgi:protein-tyrosine-phosphatase
MTDSGPSVRDEGPVRLLFICFENSCRSQMAEAFARQYGGSEVDANSAGSRPSGHVNPTAIQVMEEIGCEMSGHRSKSVADVPAQEYDAVVSMGCGDDCPVVPARRRLEWEIPDPKAMPLSQFREVRGQIEREVRGLLEELGVPA